MTFIDRLADRLGQALALVGALGVLALLLHVTGDVLSRNLLDRPIPATNEIASRYYMVTIAFLPLAWVERKGAMVRVELLDTMMPAWVLRLTEVAVVVLCIAVYAMLAKVTWDTALKNYNIGSFVDVLGHKIAVWPSYFLLPFGFAAAALMVALRPLSLILRRL